MKPGKEFAARYKAAQDWRNVRWRRQQKMAVTLNTSPLVPCAAPEPLSGALEDQQI